MILFLLSLSSIFLLLLCLPIFQTPQVPVLILLFVSRGISSLREVKSKADARLRQPRLSNRQLYQGGSGLLHSVSIILPPPQLHHQEFLPDGTLHTYL